MVWAMYAHTCGQSMNVSSLRFGRKKNTDFRKKTNIEHSVFSVVTGCEEDSVQGLWLCSFHVTMGYLTLYRYKNIAQLHQFSQNIPSVHLPAQLMLISVRLYCMIFNVRFPENQALLWKKKKKKKTGPKLSHVMSRVREYEATRCVLGVMVRMGLVRIT